MAKSGRFLFLSKYVGNCIIGRLLGEHGTRMEKIAFGALVERTDINARIREETQKNAVIKLQNSSKSVSSPYF